MRLAGDVPLVVSVHSMRSPGWMGLSPVLSTVAMPPSDRVKNSSVLGPICEKATCQTCCD